MRLSASLNIARLITIRHASRPVLGFAAAPAMMPSKSFGKRLTAAGGAAVEVRMAGQVAIERLHDSFSCDGHRMFRSVCVIDQLLVMSNSERARIARMSRVGRARGIAARQSCCQGRVAN